PGAASVRSRPARRGGQVDAGPQGPQRHPREDHRLAGGDQRRGHDRREIHLKDQFENMGAQLVKEAAIKTNDIVGDGTTTATVIAQAIVREGMESIGKGGNPVLVKRGIDLAIGHLVEYLRGVAHPVKTEEDYARVAAISANDDDAVGA